MSEQKVSIKVIRPFLVAGKRQEVGTVVADVELSDARMLIHHGKAEAVDKADESLKVPVVRSLAAASKEQKEELAKQEKQKAEQRLKAFTEEIGKLDGEALKNKAKSLGVEPKDMPAEKLREELLKAFKGK